MRKNLAKALTLSIILTGVCAWGGDSNSAYARDTKYDPAVEKPYIHNSVTCDGAYFSPYFDDKYGEPNHKNLLTFKEEQTVKNGTINVYSVAGGGTVYSTYYEDDDGIQHEVFNFNSFSGDTLSNGVTIPAMKLPETYNVNIDKLQQTYARDYAATMAALESENRVLADNKLHNDDVKNIAISSDNDGNIKTTLTFNDDTTIDSTTNIGAYVGDQIYNNAGNAKYNESMTINQAISNNNSLINANTSLINTNITNIANNKTRIDAIEQTYVKNVTKDGDIITVTKGDGTSTNLTDIHIDDFEQTADGNGIYTSTITTNETDPATGQKKTYTGTIDISGYVSNTIKNEASGGTLIINGQTTTIGGQITNNYNEINNIKNNYVKDVTKEGDTITITKGDGSSTSFNDSHITGFEQSDVGDYGSTNAGQFTSSITTNFGESYTDTIDISGYVSDAIKNEAAKGDITINGSEITIEEAITNNTNDIKQNTTDITNIKTDVSNIKNDITNINENIENINTTISNINTDITNNTNDIKDIKDNYVKDVTKDGDTITITKGDGSTTSFDDSHITGFKQSDVGDYGSTTAGQFTSTITTNFGESYTDTIDISGYVSDAIKAEAAGGSLTVNGQTTTIGNQIIENTNQIKQNTENITSNTTRIETIENTFVKDVTKEGDTITITKGDGSTTSFDDIHINDFTQTDDGKGKFTSTITTNETDPTTGQNKTYTGTIDISGYVSDTIKSEASGGTLIVNGNTTTIGNQIIENTNNINNINNDVTTIKNDYVQNVKQEGDKLTFTQVVDGQKDTFEFTDKHIDDLTMQGPGTYGEEGSGSITTTVTDNLGNEYSGSVDISKYVEGAVYENAADGKLTIDGNDTTIGNQIIENKNELNKGWNAQVDGQTVNNIKMGEAQNFVSGDNIILSGDESGAITISTKKDVSFDKITVGNTTITDNSVKVGNTTISDNSIKVGDTINITNNGIDMGDTKITNVREGDIYQGSQDAVNGGQLWNTNQRLDSLSGRVDKVGAGAAALAALHPMDFDPDDKLNFSAGVGNYGGATASAIGVFYRPNEKVMMNLAGTIGNGENMVSAGVSFAIGKGGGKVNDSKVAMAHEIADLRAQVAELTAIVTTLATKGTYDFSGSPLMFPDIPENHWAYEYIEKLSAAGIVEGYPDGNFGGDRTMTRYEFGAMLYRALLNGVDVDTRLLKEFEPELGRISIDHIRGEGLNKVERVRVIQADDRDNYGGK